MSRLYDESLRTNFRVIVEEDRGSFILLREDGVNWSLTHIQTGPVYNGSGAGNGPDTLVSPAQARAYADHIAALWNAAADAQGVS